MNANGMRSVAVLGGGVAGWLTAAALARNFGPQLRITVLEKDCDPCDAFLVASRPEVARVHAQLGIEEARLIAATAGTFNVGTEMSGWGGAGRSYFLPYGEVGSRFANVAFHQHLRRLAILGRQYNLRAYSIAAQAALARRFGHPPADARSVTSTFEYGLNLDPLLYARVLRSFALQAGVVASPAQMRGAALRADGYIEALELDDGSRLPADLFVDCSGARARILGESLGVPFESWADWLPSNRALLTQSPPDPTAMPAVSAAGQAEGWLWSVPLQNRTARAFLFDSKSCSDERAAQILVPANNAVTVLNLHSGRRAQLWARNCVAIGSAAAFLEPLASPSMQLLHSSVARLLALFPNDDHNQALAREYDRVMGGEIERARDLLALHFFAAGRAASLPEPLAYKVKLFGSRGRIAMYDEEVFTESEWVSAFAGLGFEPQRYDVLADQTEPDQVVAMLERIQMLMARAVEAMPPHMSYAARLGRS